jgi:hypothetical protein
MPCDPLSLNVPEGWLIRATEEIKSAGGSIQGDAGSGEFSIPVPVLGVVAGKYVMGASELQITITRKPFLLRLSAIQSFVCKRFGKE